MRPFPKTLALALPFITAPLAQAVLYLAGDLTFGPNSITVDTSTGVLSSSIGEKEPPNSSLARMAGANNL